VRVQGNEAHLLWLMKYCIHIHFILLRASSAIMLENVNIIGSVLTKTKC